MAMEFKGRPFEREIVLRGVRWYVAYPISYRQLEEMMGERGVEVDHSPLNRWMLKHVPLLEKASAAQKRPVGNSWRLDETYVRIKGECWGGRPYGIGCAIIGSSNDFNEGPPRWNLNGLRLTRPSMFLRFTEWITTIALC
jgi:hypothetical protein